MVRRLRKEIREPGRQNYWKGDGYTPDYSDIRSTMEELLKAGYADEVLSLGEELIEVGTNQVMMSDDNVETAMQIQSCMPVVVKALDHSSLDTVDKLSRALEVVLKDNNGIYMDISFIIATGFKGYCFIKWFFQEVRCVK